MLFELPTKIIETICTVVIYVTYLITSAKEDVIVVVCLFVC